MLGKTPPWEMTTPPSRRFSSSSFCGRMHDVRQYNVDGEIVLDHDVTHADSELQVTGNDTRLLVVTGRVTGELENLGREVFEDGGEVHCRMDDDESVLETCDQETNKPLARAVFSPGAPAPTR